MKTIGSFIDRPNGACLAVSRAPAYFRVRRREGGQALAPIGLGFRTREGLRVKVWARTVFSLACCVGS